MIEALSQGVASGIIYATSGFLPKIKKGEQLDLMLYFEAMVYGMFVGGVSYAFGLPITGANAILIQLGGISLSKRFLKFLKGFFQKD